MCNDFPLLPLPLLLLLAGVLIDCKQLILLPQVRPYAITPGQTTDGVRWLDNQEDFRFRWHRSQKTQPPSFFSTCPFLRKSTFFATNRPVESSAETGERHYQLLKRFADPSSSRLPGVHPLPLSLSILDPATTATSSSSFHCLWWGNERVCVVVFSPHQFLVCPLLRCICCVLLFVASLPVRSLQS